jgi:hypothetical protein
MTEFTGIDVTGAGSVFHGRVMGGTGGLAEGEIVAH